jgi:elongation factor G
MMQLPIGLEEKHEGVIDLVTMKAVYFRGDSGDEIVIEDIPADRLAEAEEYREIMLDAASMFSDDLMEAMMEENVSEELVYNAVRKGTIANELCPVFLGSAYKNKGVQSLLDAVIAYLPEPREVENIALDLDNEEAEVILEADPKKPTVALAFKLETVSTAS